MMEYILGGLGALCCGATIGGIGYGLYRCCTKNDLTTEIEKYNKLFLQNGGRANVMVFDVKKTNKQEIQFDITVPFDLRKVKKEFFGENVDLKLDDLPEFKQIKDDIDKKNKTSFAYNAYIKNKPYAYQLTFTISQNGELKVTRCGALNRNIHNAALWKRENMIQLLNILKSCVWSQKMTKGKQFLTTLNDNLVSLYDIINQFQNEELFNNINKNINKFYSTTSHPKEYEDVIIKRSYLSLTDVNDNKKQDKQDAISVK